MSPLPISAIGIQSEVFPAMNLVAYPVRMNACPDSWMVGMAGYNLGQALYGMRSICCAQDPFIQRCEIYSYIYSMEKSGLLLPYVVHLSKDPRLQPLIAQQGPMPIKKKRNIFAQLCASIIGQQLSTRAASVIHQRFLALYGGVLPGPEQILESPDALLREIGLSAAKASYIKAVAQFELEHGMGLKKIGKWTDEEIIAYLTRIKGVGRWTVEMLLLFTLGREDVFAVDDLGIRNAMISLYRIRKKDPKSVRNALMRISESWRPYRSYACLHLWRWRDGG